MQEQYHTAYDNLCALEQNTEIHHCAHEYIKLLEEELFNYEWLTERMKEDRNRIVKILTNKTIEEINAKDNPDSNNVHNNNGLGQKNNSSQT